MAGQSALLGRMHGCREWICEPTVFVWRGDPTARTGARQASAPSQVLQYINKHSPGSTRLP